MLKIVSPSHCFQPPTPKVFSLLLTLDVARRLSIITNLCFSLQKLYVECMQ
ncbi:hypothetical protein RGQ29_024224 [Quercus rubra]|uniref:Uncharacterized protein n=1 Tax=Quercus rubra TaxID=3512 RepID=A0AAN7F7G8_QUERU|nr:hypothetical protein RGQ29_024224 [Quercus rubra]